MSHHLKSAGNSLKSSSSSLQTLFFIPFVCFIFILIFTLSSKGSESSSIGPITIFIGVLGSIFHIATYFSLVKHLNDSGKYLILLSESLESNNFKSNSSEYVIGSQEINDEIPDVISFDNNVVKFANGVESGLFQKKITGQIIYFIETESKKYFYEDLQKGFKGSYLLKVKGIISEDGLYNS